MALTHHAHSLIRQYFANTDITKSLAVDATCGNGHDSAFLLSLGFKKLLALDIQQQAINNTQQRLNEIAEQLKTTTEISLIKQSHQHLGDYIEQSIDCIMFNFGYLPKADKSITTLADSSLIALQTALDNLSPSGIISLLCYPGHATGKIETAAIEQRLQELKKENSDWQVATHHSRLVKPDSPVLYLLTKEQSR